jgi:hypothetical protein
MEDGGAVPPLTQITQRPDVAAAGIKEGFAPAPTLTQPAKGFEVAAVFLAQA